MGGTSNFLSGNSSSSSSSSSDEDEVIAVAEQAIYNNNVIIQILLSQAARQPTRRGSIPGHVVINRDRGATNRNLIDDYFFDNPRYVETIFRRRYRMSRNLFLHIVGAIQDHDNYFEQQCDEVGRVGLSTLQKETGVIRMLAYALPADATNEYVRIGESTVIESCRRFCRAIFEVLSERYLRTLTSNYIASLLHIGEQRGFPGMLGSLDCMHWRWKNCPTAWARQYCGRSSHPTNILEVVVDYDLWIWHAYFGMSGTNNDINILQSSNLFYNLTEGIAPLARYDIQGRQYDMGYDLADNIYPKWSSTVQTIQDPQGDKKQYFAMMQESCRKDVEQAFGMLQSRFAILAGPICFWEKSVLYDILFACIIMHNMIIEGERGVGAPIIESAEIPPLPVEVVRDNNIRFQQFLARHKKIRDKEAHFAVQNALIEHLWERRARV